MRSCAVPHPCPLCLGPARNTCPHYLPDVHVELRHRIWEDTHPRTIRLPSPSCFTCRTSRLVMFQKESFNLALQEHHRPHSGLERQSSICMNIFASKQTHESPIFPELSQNHLDRACTEERDASVLSPTSNFARPNIHVRSWFSDRRTSLPFS